MRRHKPQERRDGGMDGPDGWRDKKVRQTQSSAGSPAERRAAVPLSSKPQRVLQNGRADIILTAWVQTRCYILRYDLLALLKSKRHTRLLCLFSCLPSEPVAS
ncbi:unnamed protein product [Pleuronectes platessa]|uniref:Uncharacterized protein n=1 Tax=Pleuronectes platessa TaxID=8262 RepID=A0A9N7U330_PLEPL|nr:unnamed protein product [Pleuronectes platessa]